jgi:hypothetical protein
VFGGKTILSLRRHVEGHLLLSLELILPNGTRLVKIHENFFEADPSQLHDLSLDTAPTHIRVWFSKRDIGMELSFHRVILEELEKILAIDRDRASRASEKQLSQVLSQAPQNIQELIKGRRSSSISDSMRSMLADSGLPVDIREASLSGDQTGWMVREYAKQQLDDEGKIALLDFKRLHLQAENGELVVHKGLVVQGGSSIVVRYSASFGNGQGGFNLQLSWS